jgi:hypothetical protein
MAKLYIILLPFEGWPKPHPLFVIAARNPRVPATLVPAAPDKPAADALKRRIEAVKKAAEDAKQKADAADAAAKKRKADADAAAAKKRKAADSVVTSRVMRLR